MSGPITRRRFIGVTAAAAGLAVAGLPGSSRSAVRHGWRGTALGAHAEIILYHPDREEAERLIGACLDEIARLEDVFSLYRPESALARLNRAGRLATPPFELVELLATAQRLGEQTDGAFDVTVQPLWRLYAEHFARPGADPHGPAGAAIARARALVDFRAIEVEPGAIRLARAGMALTLNGIAQGYVTDRIAGLLRAQGMTQVLLDLGEIRALGRRPDGRPWRAGLAAPRDRSRVLEEVELADMALATSSPAGTPFDRSGRHHHLFDPATGRSAQGVLQVSLRAPSATLADALSTAFCVLSPAAAQGVFAATPAREAWLWLPRGERLHWRA